MRRGVDEGVRVGRGYLLTAALAFAFGGLLALGMRWKLAWPDEAVPVLSWMHDWPGGVMPLETYARSFTLHGTVMIWLVIVPAIAWGLGLACLPRMCGARLRLAWLAWGSLWLTLVGASVLLVGWAGAGWTAYAPLGSEVVGGGGWVPYDADVASWLRAERGEGWDRAQSGWSPIALYATLGTSFALVLSTLKARSSEAHRLQSVGLEREGGVGRYRGATGASSRWRSASAWLIGWTIARLVGAGAGAVGLVVALQHVAVDGQTAWYVGVAAWAIAGCLAGTSLLATVAARRRARLPLSAIGWASAAGVGLLAGPVIVLAMAMNLLDAHGVTGFFDPDRDGQPLLHQHLFWFYGHPLVYLMILPAYGLVGDVLARHARGHVGYRAAAVSIVVVSVLGFGVWAHHMYQSGLDPGGALVFSAASMLIGIPSAVLVVTWVATIARGLRLNAATLAAIAFVSCFVVGGLSGVILAAPAVNVQLHDTYFVVAHLHYTLFGGSLFALFAGLYWLWPRLFPGRRLGEALGRWHVGLTYVAFNGTFGLMHVLGAMGMPRRSAEVIKVDAFADLAWAQQTMTVCAIALGVAQLALLGNIVQSFLTPRRKPRLPGREAPAPPVAAAAAAAS